MKRSVQESFQLSLGAFCLSSIYYKRNCIIFREVIIIKSAHSLTLEISFRSVLKLSFSLKKKKKKKKKGMRIIKSYSSFAQ